MFRRFRCEPNRNSCRSTNKNHSFPHVLRANSILFPGCPRPHGAVVLWQPGRRRITNTRFGVTGMKYRIAMWAIAGLLVAAFWALFAAATFPSTSERMRDVWTLVCITCPIAIAGMHYPIRIYETLLANAITYGVVGLIVETLRKQMHHTQYFKRHI
jgi:hypothetical protein